MKIPYGESNFAKIRTEGYFYVDKTPFLPVLEGLGSRHLLFLRPRRMGKSLFVSLLEHYYDVGQAEQFDALFGGLWIHAHPTPQRNTYLVLKFDQPGEGYAVASVNPPETGEPGQSLVDPPKEVMNRLYAGLLGKLRSGLGTAASAISTCNASRSASE